LWECGSGRKTSNGSYRVGRRKRLPHIVGQRFTFRWGGRFRLPTDFFTDRDGAEWRTGGPCVTVSGAIWGAWITDITYHGPGQIVGYPILDLREWKRDVVAYVRAIEQVIVDALADFGLKAGRVPGMTGVWVDGAKIAAIGVHVSRWVTSHGFALNATTDLSYFQYIVPCGLAKPVTSMARLGAGATRENVIGRLVFHFGRVFECDMAIASASVETGEFIYD
jgi:lipoate-protein ligase B